jgi:UDP-2,3-diacylglucosamine pyrophosphatase LpxH
MAAIRWVCVSDLHLGALNSVLTSVHADGDRVDQSSASPVLEALCDCLRELRVGQDPPQLVVLGDLFELALSSTDDAAATFAYLVKAMRPGSTDAAVSPGIRFLPGNHDHHLWSRARGDCYVDYMTGVPRGQALLPEPSATHLLPANDTFRVRDRIVELMAARTETDAPVTVEQSYPNLGLTDAAGRRVVVLSHGHFIEPLYQAMSALDDVFDHGPQGPRTVHDLEAENGAWIDFFWSSMGDSGSVAGWSRALYESLQSEDAISAEIMAIRRAIRRAPGPKVLRHVESLVVGGMLRQATKSSLRRERHVPGILSPAATTGLTDYLSGPVRAQVADEVGQAEAVTFVFGHTHKPFGDIRTLPGLPGPVGVVNTGGWVVDTPVAEPYKGATVVLVDEDLNVALFHCYRQGQGSAAAVRIDGPDAGGTNPLVDDLRARIDTDRDPWRALADAATEVERERRRQLSGRVQAETRLLDDAGGDAPATPAPMSGEGTA